jgi:NADPH-dependent 2,4-dienoyl-CoA reductase/sulfur reductase-like enzyme/rhodanese-related sulfurtransferase
MAAKRVVIVGGVAGGAACATRLRRLDEHAEITIYERGADVSYANCGLPYYVGGVISNRQQLLVATPERFRDWYNVEVRTRHEIRAIRRDTRTVEVANVITGATSEVPYDALVLSTGATPVRPRISGIDLPGVFALRSLEDVDRMRAWIEERKAARAAVVGGGFIGLEMTENLVRRGLEVTLFERLDQVMPAMDPEMVVPAQQELRRQGVDLRLSTSLAGIETGDNDHLVVVGPVGQRTAVDIVILAIGVRPDVQLARMAGLEIGTLGGIRVDEQMRTSDPAIFAVGDAVEIRDYVTGQPALVPLAGPAARQGRVAADVIAGRRSRFRGSQGTAIVGVFDVTLATTGVTEKRLQAASVPYEKIYTHSLHHAGYFPGGEMMAVKLLFDPRDGRLLGAQIAGRAGVDKRIDVLAMAIQKGSTLEDLEEAELCYAPQYGSAKDPVNIAGFAGANILHGDVDPVFWSDWQAAQALTEAQRPVVVDVRTRPEAATGAVPGSVNIPLGELRKRLDELPRDREIWVHCGVGQRSYYASRVLKQHGFRVRNLSGGMRSFQMLPVVKPEQPSSVIS